MLGLEWIRRLSPYIGGNLALQGLGFVTGILVIRLMPKDDYALYSIYIGLIFAMTTLSDSGIGSTLLSQGARKLHDVSQLSALFRAGVVFRRRIGIWVSTLGIVILVFLYLAADAKSYSIVFSAAIMIVTMQAIFTRGVWQSLFRLTYQANLAQRVLLISAFGRAGLIAAGFWLPSVFFEYLLLVTATTFWFEALALRYMAGKSLDLQAPIVDSDLRSLRTAMSKVLPLSIVSLLRGQLQVGLLTVLGSIAVVAEISALSKFAIAFAVLNAVVLEMLSPRIARLTTARSHVIRGFLLVLGAYAGIAALITSCMVFFKDFILSLLGPAYSGLEAEMTVILIGMAALNFAIALGSLNQSRNWLSGSWVVIPLTLLWALWGMLFFDLSDTYSAALWVASQAIPYLITELTRTSIGYRREIL